jgi:hypothetical protein
VPGASALTGKQPDAKGQPSCFQHAPCPLLHALGKHTSARCHPARALPWAAAIVLVAEVRAAVKPPMEFLVGRSSFPRHTTLQVGDHAVACYWHLTVLNPCESMLGCTVYVARGLQHAARAFALMDVLFLGTVKLVCGPI